MACRPYILKTPTCLGGRQPGETPGAESEPLKPYATARTLMHHVITPFLVCYKITHRLKERNCSRKLPKKIGSNPQQFQLASHPPFIKDFFYGAPVGRPFQASTDYARDIQGTAPAASYVPRHGHMDLRQRQRPTDVNVWSHGSFSFLSVPMYARLTDL